MLDQNITITEVYSGSSAWFKLSKKLRIGNKATRYALFIACEIGVSGDYSHGEGIDPWTSNEGEHAEGKYNKSNDGTISSVGIGTADNDRKNAFEIMQNGEVYIIGVGNYDGTNAGGAGVSTLQSSIGGGSTLQITGTFNGQDNEFTCTSGHSIDDIKNALLAGTPVIVDVTDSDQIRYITSDISVFYDGGWYAYSKTFAPGAIDNWVVQNL